MVVLAVTIKGIIESLDNTRCSAHVCVAPYESHNPVIASCAISGCPIVIEVSKCSLNQSDFPTGVFITVLNLEFETYMKLRRAAFRSLLLFGGQSAPWNREFNTSILDMLINSVSAYGQETDFGSLCCFKDHGELERYRCFGTESAAAVMRSKAVAIGSLCIFGDEALYHFFTSVLYVLLGSEMDECTTWRRGFMVDSHCCFIVVTVTMY